MQLQEKHWEPRAIHPWVLCARGAERHPPIDLLASESRLSAYNNTDSNSMVQEMTWSHPATNKM